MCSSVQHSRTGDIVSSKGRLFFGGACASAFRRSGAAGARRIRPSRQRGLMGATPAEEADEIQANSQ